MRAKVEVSNELFIYAAEILKNNTPCRDVGQWLKTHQFSLESFLIALTLLKHGKCDDKNYQSVVEEFKIRYQQEIEQAYKQTFWSTEKSPLYQTITKFFNSEETTQTSNCI